VILQIVSLGSLWQESTRHHLFNTTGIESCGKIASRAKVFGHIRFNSVPLHRLLATGKLLGSKWNSPNFGEGSSANTIHCSVAARRREVPELYVVTISEQLVGTMLAGSIASDYVRLISFSERGSRQEAMLLARNFASIAGQKGSAVFTPSQIDDPWKVQRWH
jgi:hypothetical protein